MDISIIIDKSTFQAMNFAEMYRLSQYYKHIITPVLVMEILGDLRKEFGSDEKPSSVRVIDFAKKLFPSDTIVNLHYSRMVSSELSGNAVPLDGRPYVGIDKATNSETGMKGYLIEKTPHEDAVYKWKDGNFSEADHLLSSIWRTTTTQEDVLERLKSALIENGTEVKINSFSELGKYVEDLLVNPAIQDKLIEMLFRNYDVDAYTKVKAFGRWDLSGRPLLRDFAPYSFHCLKVDTIFMQGLQSGLISTRPTNRVDAEYLYYIPFGNVFTSNDKFHKNIVPLLIRPDQKFIVGEELKTDFKEIVSWIGAQESLVAKNFYSLPPINDKSFTFNLWKEFYGYPDAAQFKRPKPRQEEWELAKRKMDEFERAIRTGEATFDTMDDPDFIVRETKLGPQDPCFCGSGKKLIECCLPPDQFIRAVRKQHEMGYRQ